MIIVITVIIIIIVRLIRAIMAIVIVIINGASLRVASLLLRLIKDIGGEALQSVTMSFNNANSEHGCPPTVTYIA